MIPSPLKTFLRADGTALRTPSGARECVLPCVIIVTSLLAAGAVQAAPLAVVAVLQARPSPAWGSLAVAAGLLVALLIWIAWRLPRLVLGKQVPVEAKLTRCSVRTAPVAPWALGERFDITIEYLYRVGGQAYNGRVSTRWRPRNDTENARDLTKTVMKLPAIPAVCRSRYPNRSWLQQRRFAQMLRSIPPPADTELDLFAAPPPPAQMQAQAQSQAETQAEADGEEPAPQAWGLFQCPPRVEPPPPDFEDVPVFLPDKRQ